MKTAYKKIHLYLACLTTGILCALYCNEAQHVINQNPPLSDPNKISHDDTLSTETAFYDFSMQIDDESDDDASFSKNEKHILENFSQNFSSI